MNLSMKWLSDFVNIGDLKIKDYCDKMTGTGSKVEGFEILAHDISNIVVGRIIEISQHPDADKLVVCKVDVGSSGIVQIVTGATNVFVGAVIPACLDGAHLPGGKVIKKGKLRGVESEGMLCSIEELGLTTHDMPEAAEDGILILGGADSSEFTLGMDIKDALLLNDTVVEFEITSNRPDCLSVIGLARETAVSYDLSWDVPTPLVKESGGKVEDYLKVDITSPELCKRYSARVVKNVKIAPSPLWMRMRLRAAGVRPINNIVDITNYVMLEYGQPMHAFDYACLDGNHIIVREATDGEIYKSLDENDEGRALKKGMLVIADKAKPVALAGVMGGANSEIKDTTTTVVFESASFFGSSVRLTAKALGMRTESSSRFEKGIDSELTIPALERACELVNLLCAGEVTQGIIDVYPKKKEVASIQINPDKINKFLGTKLERGYMVKVLTSLGCEVSAENVVTAPSWRDDIECMNDVAEEIIRIYGYNTIESTRFFSRITQGKRTEEQLYKMGMKDALCGLGFNEICTYSFISPKYYDNIMLPPASPLRKSVVISNPLGEDTSVMRTTALPSILEILARNNNFSNENVSVFELATVYTPKSDAGIPTELPDETVKVVMGMYGDCDFYTLKGAVDRFLATMSVSGCSYAAETENVVFHPGKCAKITASDGREIGVMGEIHPAVAEKYSLSATYAAELDFDAIFAIRNKKKQYTPLPKFPAVTRDFSFVCDESLEAGTIETAISKAGIKLLESSKLFDIYRGPQVGENKKSMSFSISLRASDRTLKDEEADNAVKKLLKHLANELGIALRA